MTNRNSRLLCAFAMALGMIFGSAHAQSGSRPSFGLSTDPTPDGGCKYIIKNNEGYPLMCHIETLANVAVPVPAYGESWSGSPYGQCPRVTVRCRRDGRLR